MSIDVAVVAMIAVAFLLSPSSDSTTVTPDPDRRKIHVETTLIEEKPRSRVGGRKPVAPVERVRDPAVCSYSDSRERLNLCSTPDPTPRPSQGRSSLDSEVLRAVRTIGLPALTVNTQPVERVLINIPTVLYTEASVFVRDVSLLGQEVRIEATPVGFRWHHGDGTSQRTRSAGAQYPKHDVTHSYSKPANKVLLRVDVTYRIRFRNRDGQWETLSETLTIPGHATRLQVSEARPYLTTG